MPVKQILEYVRASDVSMEEGSLRVDANVSARRTRETRLGTQDGSSRISTRSRACGARARRRVRPPVRDSRCGRRDRAADDAVGCEHQDDGAAGAVEGEEATTTATFPEPDLPPLIIPRARIDRIAREMPELPAARRERYARDFDSLTAYDVEVLTSEPALGEYFEHVAHASGEPKTSANWMMGEVLAAVKSTSQSIARLHRIRPADLGALLNLVRDGVVSHSAAKQIFSAMLVSGDPPADIAKRDGLLKVSDDDALSGWIDAVFADHPDEAARFVGGERRLQGVLVGHVMKKSKGSADPRRVNQLLVERSGV